MNSKEIETILEECNKQTCMSSSLQFRRENEYYKLAFALGPEIIPILLNPFKQRSWLVRNFIIGRFSEISSRDS